MRSLSGTFVLIIFHVLFTVITASSVDEIIQNVKQNATFEFGKKLIFSEGDVVNSYVDVTRNECIRKCVSKSRCNAIQYQRGPKHCTLLRKFDRVKTDPGFMVVHGLEQVDRTCGDKTCTRRETCKLDGDIYSCVIEECENPHSGRTKTNGNLYSVGSLFESKCYDGQWKTFLCADSGQWWLREGKQSWLTCEDKLFPNESVFTNGLGVTALCRDNDGMTIQRRTIGSVDFDRDWQDYKYGFGSVCGDYWMGLENIFAIINASNSQFELRITLKDGDQKTFAKYKQFRIEDESSLYRLTLNKYANGSTAVNYFEVYNGSSFSTFDRDNDGNCAREFHGGWWFGNSSCEFHGFNASLISVMKMRKKK